MTFVNHGCNGTFNFIGRENYEGWKSNDPHATITEQNYTSHEFDPFRGEFHDIYLDRHPIKPNVDVAMRDVKAGEEILNNHVFFDTNVESWKASMAELQKICSGERVGEITQAERSEVKKSSSD